MTEGLNKFGAAAHRADAALDASFELVFAFGAEVGQNDAFDVLPNPFIGVELGGIRRQRLDLHAAVSVEPLAHPGAAVGADIVPDHDDGTANPPQQGSQKLHHGRRIDRSSPQAQEQPALRRDARDGRQFLPPALGTDHRRRSARRPGSPHRRGRRKAAFVHKHYRRPLAPGFFFMRGQSRRTHSAIFSSLRSRARLTGFCQLQPNRRSKTGIYL